MYFASFIAEDDVFEQFRIFDDDGWKEMWKEFFMHSWNQLTVDAIAVDGVIGVTEDDNGS
jgi:hypothetical protein